MDTTASKEVMVVFNCDTIGIMNSIDETNERWLPVIAFEGFYSISSLGRIRSEDRTVTRKGHAVLLSGKLLSLAMNKGYSCVNLCRDGICKIHYIHQLVARHFIGECP